MEDVVRCARLVAAAVAAAFTLLIPALSSAQPSAVPNLTVTPRVFLAPEFTLGWEPHIRVSVTVGIRLQ